MSDKAKKQFEQTIYNKITPVLNNIAGLDNNDQFSIGLFLKLGINFDFIIDKDVNSVGKYDHAKQQGKCIEDILMRMNAYVKFQDNQFEKSNAVVINIKIKEESDISNAIELMETDAVMQFFAFVYLHEVQHILRKHNTKVFDSLMKNTISKNSETGFTDNVGEKGIHTLINIAEDYAINNSIIELLKESNNEPVKNLLRNLDDSNVLKKDAYNGLSEVDIIKLIIKDDEITKNLGNQMIGENGRLGRLIEDIINTIGQADSEKDKRKLDNEMDALSESIKKVIEKNAGKEGFKLDKMVKNAIKVDVRWFEKLQQGLYTYINKKTKNSVAKWSNLDIKMRHIYKSPKRENIEKKIDMVVSIDQSGSISYESLGKLLYLFQKKARSINTISMIFHDTQIAHIEHFEGSYDHKAIVNAARKRHCGGGTSHKEVFKWLDDNIKNRDIKRKIYISFSDNYSDIEETYHEHTTIKKISKIWLNSDGRDVDAKIGGLRVQFN